MIPAKKDPRWASLVKGEQEFQLSGFATKMLLGKVRVKIQLDPSDENIKSSIEEVYSFFIENEELVETDLKIIFG